MGVKSDFERYQCDILSIALRQVFRFTNTLFKCLKFLVNQKNNKAIPFNLVDDLVKVGPPMTFELQNRKSMHISVIVKDRAKLMIFMDHSYL